MSRLIEQLELAIEYALNNSLVQVPLSSGSRYSIVLLRREQIAQLWLGGRLVGSLRLRVS